MKRFIMLLFSFIATQSIAQQWCIEYSSEEHENISLRCGDKSGDYDYVVGTYHDKLENDRFPMAISIDGNGGFRDTIYVFEGKKSWFNLAHGLGDGNVFVVAPYSDDDETEMYENLWIAVLSPDLEIIVDNFIKLDKPYISFRGMSYALENNEDEIVVVTRVTDSIPPHTDVSCDYSFYVFDKRCNLLRHSYIDNPTNNSDIDDFILVPNGEYALFGNGMHVSGMSNINYFDKDFNHLSTVFFDDMTSYPDLLLPVRMCSDYWYDESHFLMSAQSINTDGINEWKPFAVKVDTDMNVLKTLDLERADTTDYVFQYKNMSYVDKDNIYITTFMERGGFMDVLSNSMTVYLINDNLDLLGRISVDFEEYFYGLHSHSTADGGCLLVGKLDFDNKGMTVLYKFNGDDFEIQTDVREYDDGIETECFPNPVSSSLNILVENVTDTQARLYVEDISGRRYLDKEIALDGDVLSIDVSPLESGVYVCAVIVNGKYVYKDKFVKK